MKLKLQFLIAAFIGLVIYIPVGHGQANLTFSGGNGTPLSITLQNAVTYTINNTQCAASGPVFVFQGVGDIFSGTGRASTGTMSYSINSGTSKLITATGSGANNGNIKANDVYVSGVTSPTSNGNTIVLNVGTITTTTNVAAAPPAGGSFTTFIVNVNGDSCSSNGVAMTTAAPVSISGRVMTPSGRGIMNVRLSLTDSQGNVRTAMTTSFGYYQFTDVQVGETYILSATAKHYTFSQPVQVLNINEETTEVNFIAKQVIRNIVI